MPNDSLCLLANVQLNLLHTVVEKLTGPALTSAFSPSRQFPYVLHLRAIIHDRTSEASQPTRRGPSLRWRGKWPSFTYL